MNGTLTITPAEITIQVKDAVKTCGEADPEIEAVIEVKSGVVNVEDLNVVVTRAAGETAGEYAYQVSYTESGNYVVTVSAGKLTIEEKEDETPAGIPVKFTPGEGAGTIQPGAIVDIDGVSYELDENCWAWIDAEDYKELMLATTYKYHVGKTAHETYPTNMYVWEVTLVKDDEGNPVEYTAKPVDELTDFMQYKGTSIRVNFSSNGIRFFTAIPSDGLDKLMAGSLLDGSLEGYKLVAAGTLFMWEDSGNSLTVDGTATSYVYGGTAGDSFRVFSTTGGDDWYTGMLVGLGDDAATLNRDLVVRPFMTIEKDGNQITIYGGTYQRDIYYVATQNRNYWAEGTAYDNYIENIIAVAEGSK